MSVPSTCSFLLHVPSFYTSLPSYVSSICSLHFYASSRLGVVSYLVVSPVPSPSYPISTTPSLILSPCDVALTHDFMVPWHHVYAYHALMVLSNEECWDVLPCYSADDLQRPDTSPCLSCMSTLLDALFLLMKCTTYGDPSCFR